MALTQEKANLIVSEYLSNGFNKTQALLSAGYSKTYAQSGPGQRLFDNVRIKQGIDRVEAEKKLVATYDRATHINHLNNLLKALQPKVDDGNVQAIRTATQILSELAASNGLHTQTINTDSEQIAEIDDNKRAEAKRLAVLRIQEIA